MLKFFFNRYSFMVTLMEILGIIGALLILRQISTGGYSYSHKIIFYLILALYMFLRFSCLVSWHRGKKRSEGIGLHFLKAMVPTNYIMAVSTWCYIAFKNLAIIVVAAFLLAIIAHVNIILIGLHFKYFKSGFGPVTAPKNDADKIEPSSALHIST